jgi:hypothetical protein
VFISRFQHNSNLMLVGDEEQHLSNAYVNAENG